MKLNSMHLTAILFAVALGPVGAQASTLLYTLNRDACTGGCGVSPFATVSLQEYGSGTSAYVLVTETLSANENYAGTGAGSALEFNVSGTITIANVTANFGTNGSQAQGSYKGYNGLQFYHAVTCLTCQGGTGPAGPLSFEVHSASGVTAASFGTVNNNAYYFSSDILGNNGNTGNVGTDTAGVLQVQATPEPGTMTLALGASLVLLWGRRRNRFAVR